MSRKRLMSLEEYLACPRCGSKDWSKKGPEGEIKTFTCMNNNCGSPYQIAHQFRPDDCRPWMRPHTSIVSGGALPGKSCCIDAPGQPSKRKRCHLHDSANYTQTNNRQWFYKPAPRLLSPLEILEQQHKAGIITYDELVRTISEVPPAVPGKGPKEDQGKKARAYRDKREGKTRPPKDTGSLRSSIHKGSAYAPHVEYGVPANPTPVAPKEPTQASKPGGVPTAGGWSGKPAKGQETATGTGCKTGILIALFGAAASVGLAYLVEWMRGGF